MSKKFAKEVEEVAQTYEASLRYLVSVSNRNAWFIAFGAWALAAFAILALVLLMPLKTTEPYVVKVDSATGQSEVITLLDAKQLDGLEALDKFFVNEYVKAREGYFYNLLEQDYIKTQLYSSPAVRDEYLKIYEGDDSRLEKLKDTHEVRINVKSIVLGESAGVKTATVRFDYVDKYLTTGEISTAAKIATLGYDYLLSASISEANRTENPLGFQVLTYRVDFELER